MANVMISETFINHSKGYCIGDTDPYEMGRNDVALAMNQPYTSVCDRRYVARGIRAYRRFTREHKGN